MNQLNKFLQEIIICPKCKNSFQFDQDKIICPVCKSSYLFENDIPVLLDEKDVSQDLMLTIEKWNQEYRKLCSKDIAKEKAKYNQIHLKEAQREINQFILPKHKIFLEIGCGPAFLSLNMAKKGYTVIGIDISIEALKIAQKVFEREKVNGYFICGNILEMPLRDNSVDFINGGGVIEHFKDTHKAVQEIYRVLNKNGIALNTVPYLSLAIFYSQLRGNIPDFPFLKELAEFLHIKVLKSKHMRFGYEKSFSQKRMKKIFTQVGFNNIKTNFFDCYLPLSFINNHSIKKVLRKLSQYQLFWPMIYIVAQK